MIFTKSDKACFNAAHECHICGDPLDEDHVRDHGTLVVNFVELHMKTVTRTTKCQSKVLPFSRHTFL